MQPRLVTLPAEVLSDLLDLAGRAYRVLDEERQSAAQVAFGNSKHQWARDAFREADEACVAAGAAILKGQQALAQEHVVTLRVFNVDPRKEA